MTLTAPVAIAATRTSLARYQRALGPGPESDAAIDAAWYLHRCVDQLLPLAEQMLAEREALAAKLDVARRDPLTGLPNRAAWEIATEQLLLTSIPAIVLVMVDLVDFKTVNDSYGHQAGDHVLAVTGARLADWAGPEAPASRLGGDEYAAAMGDTADLPDRIAKLRDLLARPVDYDGHQLTVGASIGWATTATLPAPGLSQLMRAADLAMYADKGRGRRGRRRWLPALNAA